MKTLFHYYRFQHSSPAKTHTIANFKAETCLALWSIFRRSLPGYDDRERSRSHGAEGTAPPLRTRSLQVHRRLFSPPCADVREFRDLSSTKDPCLPRTLTRRPRPLSVFQIFGASDHRARAVDVLVRRRHSVLPPAVRDPCVRSAQLPNTQGEQKGPQAALVKTQPGLGRSPRPAASG